MKTLCPLGNKKNSYTLFQIKQNQINSWGFGYLKNQTNLPLSRDFWWFKLYAFAFYFDFKFKSSIKLMESLDFIFYSPDNKSDHNSYWNSNEGCVELANIIATAAALKEIWIDEKKNEWKVKVTMIC